MSQYGDLVPGLDALRARHQVLSFGDDGIHLHDEDFGLKASLTAAHGGGYEVTYYGRGPNVFTVRATEPMPWDEAVYEFTAELMRLADLS